MLFIKKNIIYIILLVVLASILYYPALWNDYVWDDVIIFVDRDFWREGHSLWYMISQPVLEGTSYFRPLVFLTFVAEFEFFGLKPFVSHFVNLFIFCLNIILVYLLSYKLGYLLQKNKPHYYALVLSVLYVTSPILIESTVWAVGRFDLMVTTFILLGSYLYLQLKAHIFKDILLSLVFLMGLFSKELAVILPLIIFMLGHYFLNEKRFFTGIIQFIRQEYRLIVFLGITFLVYLLIRINSMEQIYHRVNHNLSPELEAITYIHFLFPLNTFYEYVKAFFIPFYPNIIHQIDYAFIGDWRGKLASLGAFVMILSIVYGVVWRKNFAAYMFFCAVLCLLPVLRIIPLGVPETIIHERFMTTALVFFLLGVVFFPWEAVFKNLNALRAKNIVLSTMFAFYVVFGVIGIYVTVPMWSNNLVLWKWAYENNKDSKIALQSYLTYLHEYKNYNEFVRIVDERRSEITMSSEVLYYAYLLEHDDPETKKYIDGMIQSLNPLHEIIKDRNEYKLNDIRLTELGSIYHLNAYYYVLVGKDLNNALKNIDIALWYDPLNKQYTLLKSIILLALGGKQESEMYWEKATQAVHVSKLNGFEDQRKSVIDQMCVDGLVIDKSLCSVNVHKDL